MKILVVRPLSNISTDIAFGEGLKMGIPHLNDLCFLLLEFVGAAAHTVFTELDDLEFFSRGMASIKSTASYISLTFLFLYKYYKSISEFSIFKMKL